MRKGGDSVAQSDKNTLIQVAKLYYNGGCSQEQIAEIFQVSRPKVSRMLALARSLKIVEFKICDSPLLIDKMQQQLREYLAIDEVIIVPSGNTPSHSQQMAGRMAAEYLHEHLFNGISIGVTWGTTTESMISQFQLKKAVSGATIFQLAGGMPTSKVSFDGRSLILALSQKLHAEYSLLQAPFLVSSKAVRDTLMAEPEIATHFQRCAHIDMAFIGISSLLPEKSTPYKAGYISLQQARELVETGFATDICGSRIYTDGSVRDNPISDRVIAIPLQQLRSIPNIVAVATGEDKVSNICSAAKGGFITTLITDEVTAIAILGTGNSK